MPAKLISGKDISKRLIETNLTPRVEALKAKGITPKLVVILIGDDPASHVYVGQKERMCQKIGIISEVIRLPDTVTEDAVLDKLKELNKDQSGHGIIVQVPVPDHISVDKIVETILPKKDVDGFSVHNIGELFQGRKTLECCTPKGIITMLEESGVEIAGKHAVVVGRSNNVGKPVAMLLLNKNATVTICHSRTKNLNNILAQAEILVVAVGRPEFIHGDQIPTGCVVIDVGIHRKNVGADTVRPLLCGDVHFESAKGKASMISPVPGGVGPMTVYSLIENTIQSAEIIN